MSSHCRAVLGILIAVGLPTPLDAADREQLDGLRASLSADTGDCPQGGLYSFRLTLSNAGSERVQASLVLTRFSLGYLKILYRRPPEPFTELTYPRDWYPSPFPHPGTTMVDLGPGESRGFDLVVGADPGHRRAVFREPGEYEIKVVLRSVTRESAWTLETEGLMVRVVPMDDQFQNLSALWDYEMVALAQGDLRMERLGELAPRGLRIIEAAPESRYARALRTELLMFLDMTPGETSRHPQLLEIRNRLKTGAP